MKKRIVASLTLPIMLVVVGLGVVKSTTAADVESLRGSVGLLELEMQRPKSQRKQQGGFDRNYQLQPPLIPHRISNEHITARSNTCMRCHDKKNFEREGAPQIAKSHYFDRDGNELTQLAARRYFCTQCHVPQADASALVGNTF